MSDYRLCRLKPKIRYTIMLATCCLIISNLVGCEAFVKKFTRKPKKTEVQEVPVLVPEDYSLSDIPIEERYRKYFLFWQSWQDELINALGSSASYKKIETCIQEAINNLQEIRPFLFEEKQKGLDVYLERLRNLERQVSQDVYGIKSDAHMRTAEILKRNILRDFAYPKVKNHLR